MPPELVVQALETFGVRLIDAPAPTDAQSGAEVYWVQTASGQLAYLKVTAAALGSEALATAKRELRFYRQLAPSVPIRTPPLLTALNSDLGMALLLGDAGEQRPVERWLSHDWEAVGRALAGLHTLPPPAGAWIRPDGLWTELEDPDLDGIRAFWAAELPALETLLARTKALVARLGAQPPVFVHGDCHAGNIVFAADGGPVLCDWQSAGVGRAPSDLAFLGVRAAPTGIQVPAVMLEAYLDQRRGLDPAFDHTGFATAVAWEELAVLVFEWPPYATYNNALGNGRVHRRAQELADRLDLTGVDVKDAR